MEHIEKKLHSFRVLQFLLISCICAICFLPLPALAGGSTGNLSWDLSGGTLTISGKGEMVDYTDAHMAPWYDTADAINRIVVKDGVTSIGDLAFYGCEKVSSVTLPSSVTSIGDRAFKQCSSMTSLSFPQGLTSIGEAAFEECGKLQGLSLPSGLTSIDDYAFYRCTSLSSVTVPASVEHFGMVTFAYCTGLTRAQILCPLTKLPDWTFYGCTALSSVSLPDTVTETGDKALENCQNLSGIYYDGTADVTPKDQYDPPVVKPTEEFPKKDETSSQLPSASDSDEVTSKVSDTDNATITTVVKTDYTYKKDGQDTTLDEILSSGDLDGVETDSKTSTTIDATIKNSDGWKELEDTVDDVLDRSETTVKVDVQLPDSKVSGKDLSGLVGKDTDVTLTTPDGSTWRLNGNTVRKSDLSKKEYDFRYTVTKLDKKIRGIDSETVYQIKFYGNIDFVATAGINLKVGNAGQYATLYQKSMFSMSQLKTVVVDENGYAWFPMTGVKSGAKYYVGINAADADVSEAVIPESMADAYAMDDEYTLTDASGTKYEVGERTSRWGISGLKFAGMVAAAIAGIIILVTLIMVTWNKFAQSKEKYRRMAEEDEANAIDEDALRMEVMRELLAEREGKKESESEEPEGSDEEDKE